MIREGLRRLVRAACAALDEDTVVIIGSQSILGSFGDFMLPAAATISVEPDLLPFDDLDDSKADQIDGLLGADSYFASKYGIYADGVSAWTDTCRRGGISDSSGSTTQSRVRSGCACIPRTSASRNSSLVDPAVIANRLEAVPLRPSEVLLKSRVELRLRTIPRPRSYATGPPVARADMMRLGDKLQRMAEAARRPDAAGPDAVPPRSADVRTAFVTGW